MRDVLDKLYDGDVCSIAQNSCRNYWVMQEAAAEIERLRGMLKAHDINPDAEYISKTGLRVDPPLKTEGKF